MNDHKIHFRNKTFTAQVIGCGEKPIKCTPVVYEDPGHCGVSLLYENGTGQIWGPMCPRNLIAAWRGTEVLRHLKEIDSGTLCGAYHTGLRKPHESDLEKYVEPTVAKIGRPTYDAIMSLPVPEQIIQAILDNQGEEFAPDLWPVTDEVRAGTIEWREEFVRAGIKHPKEVDDAKRAQDEIIARFEKLLQHYASTTHLPRQCLGMGHMESALLTLVTKKADKSHSSEILVAVAAAASELATMEFACMLMPMGPSNQEEYDRRMEETKKQAIRKSADWLVSRTGLSRFFAIGRRDKFINRLTKLLDEYFPFNQEPAVV